LLSKQPLLFAASHQRADSKTNKLVFEEQAIFALQK